MKKQLLIATLAAGLGMAAYSTQAAASDPVAGMIVGGAIGAAAGGPVGAAVGAIIGSAIAIDHHPRRHWRDRHGYRDHPYERRYDRYEPRYDREPAYREYREPARHYERYEGPRYYEARNYREAPRYYRDEPRPYYRGGEYYREEPRYYYR